MDKNLEEDILSILYATLKDEKIHINESEIASLLKQDSKTIHSTCVSLQIRKYVDSTNIVQTYWYITDYGIKALDTTYNKEFQEKERKEKERKKKIEDTTLTIQKLGVTGAWIIGSAGLIIAILAYLKN
ncbi:MAG: hypothetical protein OES23_06825 [Nitrosopumilus sp.]|nr:hypothetical protein [Nitrosopumilus sp.]